MSRAVSDGAAAAWSASYVPVPSMHQEADDPPPPSRHTGPPGGTSPRPAPLLPARSSSAANCRLTIPAHTGGGAAAPSQPPTGDDAGSLPVTRPSSSAPVRWSHVFHAPPKATLVPAAPRATPPLGARACYFLLGAGLLAAWNALITATDYFGAVYPGWHTDRLFTVSYLPVCMVMLAVGIRYPDLPSPPVRIRCGFLGFTAAMAAVPLLDALMVAPAGVSGGSSDAAAAAAAAPVGGLLAVLLCVAVVGACDGLCQGALFGEAARLPPPYTQALVSGTASSGLLVCLLRLASKASFEVPVEGQAAADRARGLRDGTRIYFALAGLLSFTCLIVYDAVLPRLRTLPPRGSASPLPSPRGAAVHDGGYGSGGGEMSDGEDGEHASEGVYEHHPLLLPPPLELSKEVRPGGAAAAIAADATAAGASGVADIGVDDDRWSPSLPSAAPASRCLDTDPRVSCASGAVASTTATAVDGAETDGTSKALCMPGDGCSSGSGGVGSLTAGGLSSSSAPHGSFAGAIARSAGAIARSAGAIARSAGAIARSAGCRGGSERDGGREAACSGGGGVGSSSGGGGGGGGGVRLQIRRCLSLSWPLCCSLFVTYTVTLSIFPGFLAEDVHSATLGDWYPILLITAFNAADLLGKSLPCLELEPELEPDAQPTAGTSTSTRISISCQETKSPQLQQHQSLQGGADPERGLPPQPQQPRSKSQQQQQRAQWPNYQEPQGDDGDHHDHDSQDPDHPDLQQVPLLLRSQPGNKGSSSSSGAVRSVSMSGRVSGGGGGRACGRDLAASLLRPLRRPRGLLAASLVRGCAALPAFMVAARWQAPAWVMAALTAALGVSNGYLTTQVLTMGPAAALTAPPTPSAPPPAQRPDGSDGGAAAAATDGGGYRPLPAAALQGVVGAGVGGLRADTVPAPHGGLAAGPGPSLGPELLEGGLGSRRGGAGGAEHKHDDAEVVETLLVLCLVAGLNAGAYLGWLWLL